VHNAARSCLRVTSLLLALCNCSGQALQSPDDLPPYLILSGPLPSGLSADTPAAAIAWVAYTQGKVASALTGAPFEARLGGYAIELRSLPEFDASVPSAVDPLAGLVGLDLLIGLPYLCDSSDPESPRCRATIDAQALLEWWTTPLGDPYTVLSPQNGDRLLALPTEHMLVLMNSDLDLQALEAHPGYDPNEHCFAGATLQGLTLYRREGSSCGARWVPLGVPGEYTEFQGIAMDAAPLP